MADQIPERGQNRISRFEPNLPSKPLTPIRVDISRDQSLSVWVKAPDTTLCRVANVLSGCALEIAVERIKCITERAVVSGRRSLRGSGNVE